MSAVAPDRLLASSGAGRRCSSSLILGVGIWSATLSPFFLTRLNLLDLVTPYIFIGLMALGLTFVVIAGEIDISVASILAVCVGRRSPSLVSAA